MSNMALLARKRAGSHSCRQEFWHSGRTSHAVAIKQIAAGFSVDLGAWRAVGCVVTAGVAVGRNHTYQAPPATSSIAVNSPMNNHRRLVVI